MPSKPATARICGREPASVSFRRAPVGNGVAVSTFVPLQESNTIAGLADREDRIGLGLRYKDLAA